MDYKSLQWLYRFEDVLHTERVHIYENSYRVIKETPCGYWIDAFSDKNKWVSKTARKRYAYPTRYEAMINFKARKNCQIRILYGQLQRAKDALYYFDHDIKDIEVPKDFIEEKEMEVE